MPARSLAGLLLGAAVVPAVKGAPPSPNPAFLLEFADGAVVSLKPAYGATDTEYLASGGRLGEVFLRYRGEDGAWQEADTADRDRRMRHTTQPDDRTHRTVSAFTDPSGLLLQLQSGFRVGGSNVVWEVVVRNLASRSLEIGDLGVALPINRGGRGRRGQEADSPRLPVILKHSFIAGHASFLYWMRSDLAGPHLVMVPTGDTHLEYWLGGRGAFRVSMHSAAAGEEARQRGTRWRQGDYRIYQARFRRLGENRLTVRYGEDRHMILEFFSTEPLETLIKKRGAFIASHQVRDPGKWYDAERHIADGAVDHRGQTVLALPLASGGTRRFRLARTAENETR